MLVLDSPGSGTTDVICEYVETLFLENNVLGFEQFFRTWLQDNGSDDVHLIVHFNDDDDDDMTSGFELKCDLADVLVNPVNVNGSQELMLQTDLDFSYPPTATSKSKQLSKLSVYVLRPCALLKTSDVCESVLYGLPRVVKPTTCWKLEWGELEKNQSYFDAVRSHLQQEEQCLLLCHIQLPQQIGGYFLLLPSSSSTMLVKAIAVRELMMPHETIPVTTTNNQEVSELVQKRLKKLPLNHGYNPFAYTCGLFNKHSNTTGARNATLKNPSKSSNTNQSRNNQSWKSVTSLQSISNDSNTPRHYQRASSKQCNNKIDNSNSSNVANNMGNRNKTPLKKTLGVRGRTPSKSSASNESIDEGVVSEFTIDDEVVSKFTVDDDVANKFSLLPPGLLGCDSPPTSPTEATAPAAAASATADMSSKYVPRFNVKSKTIVGGGRTFSSDDAVAMTSTSRNTRVFTPAFKKQKM